MIVKQRTRSPLIAFEQCDNCNELIETDHWYVCSDATTCAEAFAEEDAAESPHHMCERCGINAPYPMAE